MFRQPEARLTSAYFHMRELIRQPPARKPPPVTRSRGRGLPSPKRVDCCWDDWGWKRAVYSTVHRDVMRGLPVEEAVGRFHGCQTNMILGKGCMSGYAKSPAHVSQAMSHMNEFQFVGDVGHWNLSMCLFNAMFTGRRFTLRHQLLNSRPTKSKQLPPAAPPNSSRADLRKAMQEAARASKLQSKDRIDGALYASAQLRFWHDVKAFRVSQECCPSLESIHDLQEDPSACLASPPPPPSPARAKRTGRMATASHMRKGSSRHKNKLTTELPRARNQQSAEAARGGADTKNAASKGLLQFLFG